MDKKKRNKLIIFAVVTVLAIVLAVIEPFAGLDRKGMIFLGIFIWWLMMMIVELIPAYMSCLAALMIAVAAKCGDTATALNAFAGTTVWLLIGAFGLATALVNSGFLNRLALNIMRLFPGTYTGQLLGLSAASLVVAPCIPSTTAKCTILVPIAGVISDKLGFEKNSKGALGLFHTVNVLTNMGGCIFMTGGVVVGIMIATAGASFTWFGWLKFALIWGVVLIALTILYSLFFCKPTEAKKVTKEDLKAMVDELGPMNKKEKSALIILVATILAWMLESVHGIPTYAVAIIAWILMAACGLFSMADLMTKILWPIVLQVGGILGVITLLGTTGVSAWISSFVAPVVSAVSGTPVLVIAIVSILSSAMMFAMIQGPVSCAVFVALLAGSSISPICVALAALISAQVFVFEFQLPTVLAAEGVYNGRIDHKTYSKCGWVYIVCNLVALIASVPYWSMIGLIG